MNAKLLTGIVAVLGLLLALLIGTAIGEGTYLPIYIGLGVVFLLSFFLLFGRSVSPEAKMVAALIFGYTSFQRLFAELNIGRTVYVGEVGLALILAVLLARIAFQKLNPLPPHALTVPISLLLVFGVLRFALVDFKAFGLMAARDLATVYYALFFYVGYAVARQKGAAEFVLRTFHFAAVLYIPLICILRLLAPLHWTLEWGALALGTRDMASIVPAVGFLLCLLYSVRSRRPFLWLGIAFVPLGTTIMGTERSAYLALVGGSLIVLFVISRSGLGFLTRVGGMVVLLGLALGMLFLYSQVTGGAQLTLAAEKVQNIADIGAFQDRNSAVSGSSSSYSEETNRWRTTWWTIVYKETMDKSPWFGLGFGYDLTNRFIREYYADRGEVRARNPHNIVFTLLGRTGLLGAGLFCIFIVIFVVNVLRVSRAVRRRAQPLENLEPWLITFVILTMAIFSHTLEGPMASIPFWTFLGIGVAQQVAVRRKPAVDAPLAIPVMPRQSRFAQPAPA